MFKSEVNLILYKVVVEECVYTYELFVSGVYVCSWRGVPAAHRMNRCPHSSGCQTGRTPVAPRCICRSHTGTARGRLLCHHGRIFLPIISQTIIITHTLFLTINVL